MRKLLVLALSGLLVFVLAGSASARPMNWEGTLHLLLGEFPEEDFEGAGVATLNDSSGLIPSHLENLRVAASRGGITANVTQFVTDPDTLGNGIFAIQYIDIELGTGTLGPISGGASSGQGLTMGVLPLRGTVRLCVVNTSCAFFLPLVLTQATQNGAEIGVGIGGQLTIGGDSPIRISLEAAPWTIKNVTVIDQITTTGGLQSNQTVRLNAFAHDPSSGTTNTAQPSGYVQLVTPVQVKTNLPLGSNKNVGAGETLKIHFIPEPGLLLLIGSGVAGLALLGRRQLRK